jgi:chemotaxis protein histidine kinase CheA
MLLIQSSLTSWASVATDMLRLATHEVAAGRAGRATLALATAAQQLAAACSDTAVAVVDQLRELADARGDTEVWDKLFTQMQLVEHAANVAFNQQRMLEALRALRAAVTGWQCGCAASAGPDDDHNPDVLRQAAYPEQQQMQEEQQDKEHQLTGDRQEQQQQQQQQQHEQQQVDHFNQVHQEVKQQQEQLEQQLCQEQQHLEQLQLNIQQQLQHNKQAREEQQEEHCQQRQQLAAQQQQQQQQQPMGDMLQRQLRDVEELLADQEEAHAHRRLDQQVLAYDSYRCAVTHSARDVTAASRTCLRLAGCSWAGCKQQHKGTYSADAAVAGRRGLVCGGCGLVRYCCPQHQQADWQRHSRVCQRLARARAAAGCGTAGTTTAGGCGAGAS